ncbi:MAG: thymidine phosphorylase [Nitrospirota bacterium]
MRAADIIGKKRDGQALSDEEIAFFIQGVASGSIPDYQASALLMAVTLRGMDEAETVSLTRAMLRSGRVLDLASVGAPRVDKHSTGGVGDKVSLILAPLAAAMAVKVPMVSGRGLGHTGGTLDKLESIPGFRTDLGPEEFAANVKELGLCITGQTEELAPADRKLYALRDVTATVRSVPLIAASIMSKKLAEGVQGLLLDVKCGSGAFMKTLEDARELARAMVRIGGSMGVATAALITNMEQPLGKAVGNSLEVKECISALKGKGARDLMELTLVQTAWMLNLADSISEETEVRPLNQWTLKKYREEAMDYLEKGDALRKFVQMVDAQGGDPEAVFEPSRLPLAENITPVAAPANGVVRKLDAYKVGRASMLLGAGRERAGEPVDPAAGIILSKKVGNEIRSGEPVAMFHYNDAARLAEARDVFLSGLEIGDREPAPQPLVLDVVLTA